MARLFGTDGVRGLANRDLSAELALDLSVAAAHVLGDLGAFAWRFNRRFVLKTIHERLAIAATTTPPMPYRLLKLAEARW